MGAPDYSTAAAALHARLGDESFAHCERVAATAVSLAETYGVDRDLAELAGLLHDWDRERSPAELLESAESLGLTSGDADVRVPYLLHARTGAEELGVAFPGIDPAVVLAVARHTVGAAAMGPLDMVVYLADMIEPARSYEGVDALRDAVGTVDLPELFARGFQQSLGHLVRERRWIHPDTVAVWNDLVAGGTDE